MTRRTLLLLGITLVMGSACTPVVANRGNMVKDEQISEVIPGLHTRSDVLSKLGSPTTVAPFDENVWYYIGQETEKKGILDPKVIEERIVEVRFSDTGSVLAIGPVDAERIDIPVERNKTPTHGNDMTFLQQLLGNVGRFNPASDPGL